MELDHVVPDDVLRTLKLKQLAKMLVLINCYVFVFVKSASQSLLPPARNLSMATCCLKTFKTAEKGLCPSLVRQSGPLRLGLPEGAHA